MEKETRRKYKLSINQESQFLPIIPWQLAIAATLKKVKTNVTNAAAAADNKKPAAIPYLENFFTTTGTKNLCFLLIKSPFSYEYIKCLCILISNIVLRVLHFQVSVKYH